jgi:glutamyl-tRNA reductase
LDDRKVLLLGAGKMSELSAQYLHKVGARNVCVISQTLEHARELAATIGGVVAPFEERLAQVQQADVVISSTSCPQVIVTREDVERVAAQRDGAPLLLIDIAMPRDIDPDVRSVPGVFLYDVDELEQAANKDGERGRKAATSEAEKIVAAEARLFHTRLLGEVVAPTIVALRGRLDEICRQELEALRRDAGGMSEEQYAALQVLATRITQRIAGSLARELKELPEKIEQERLTQAVQRLFHLEAFQATAVGHHN